ncbi:aminotransferase class V-fold PLP-dependent enzyme, partial [Gemmatimonadota bacterium]
MGMDLNTKLRNFHQAKWDEPIIFELSRPGERGVLMPKVDPGIEDEVGDGLSTLPANMVRKDPPALPEVGQMQVLKHYLRLSQENLGADLNVDIGQGTCTMKYSPKVNEQFATHPKFTEVHPLQPEESIQGILEIIHQLDLYLREISGLDRFSFQPGGGSHAILGMASMVRAYHQAAGEGNQRDEIITTIFSHPSDYSAASVLGYKVINLYPDPDGMPDLDALKTALSDRTAALFITNPEDTGIFNARIHEFTDAVHEVGGLCGYDQANANGILGITRAREAGFDPRVIE